MAEALISSGAMTREQLNAGVAAEAAGLPTDGYTAPAATPASNAHDRSTEGGLRAMAAAMRERGSISQEEADAMIASDLAEIDGAAPNPDLGKPPADLLQNVNPLEPWEDRADNLTAYSIEGAPRTDMDGKELSLDYLRSCQQACFDARLPAATAKFLGNEIANMARAPVTGVALELLGKSTDIQATGWWGSRKDEYLAYGRRLVNELSVKYPDLKPTLSRTGAGNSPILVRMLAEHGARLYGKRS
jgi:hypothetical protein